MHKSGIRSDLNTWLPEKVYPTIVPSEAKNKEEKEVLVEVLFDCWPLRDLSAD